MNDQPYRRRPRHCDPNLGRPGNIVISETGRSVFVIDAKGKHVPVQPGTARFHAEQVLQQVASTK
jgi:hypothetical protein